MREASRRRLASVSERLDDEILNLNGTIDESSADKESDGLMYGRDSARDDSGQFGLSAAGRVSDGEDGDGRRSGAEGASGDEEVSSSVSHVVPIIPVEPALCVASGCGVLGSGGVPVVGPCPGEWLALCIQRAWRSRGRGKMDIQLGIAPEAHVQVSHQHR